MITFLSWFVGLFVLSIIVGALWPDKEYQNDLSKDKSGPESYWEAENGIWKGKDNKKN